MSFPAGCLAGPQRVAHPPSQGVMTGEGVLSLFGWVAAKADLPPQWDLRRAGWTLVPVAPVCLVDMRGPPAGVAPTQLIGAIDPRRCLFLGVDCGGERVRLLRGGCGEALPGTVELPELEQRVQRVAAARECLPRRRQVGPLTLDLLHRDARGERGWLALHPREFALLWRLAERPGELVSRARLLREVWRLEFEPGTNSVEVHVSRLRAKLAGAGIEGLVETDPQGGYRLAGRCGVPVEQRLCA
jgi:two-component system, OmpR family, response regulator